MPDATILDVSDEKIVDIELAEVKESSKNEITIAEPCAMDVSQFETQKDENRMDSIEQIKTSEEE